ncbi:hypothetical protein CcCBS67573_g03844 [Chytriomyces confervae]|uniref:C2H2-type domain-containing protein n=1 Tax=Chytriomyces confervae TaxID=246404 RepID=A0A507FF67_9FUNG|nr:hypothetical protein HDU80_006482 [Chytriomyces hyalinus]TPX74873.1 hypothetical protein CcCBS67573_g03844 [Chytriomyces confervae]
MTIEPHEFDVSDLRMHELLSLMPQFHTFSALDSPHASQHQLLGLGLHFEPDFNLETAIISDPTLQQHPPPFFSLYTTNPFSGMHGFHDEAGCWPTLIPDSEFSGSQHPHTTIISPTPSPLASTESTPPQLPVDALVSHAPLRTAKTVKRPRSYSFNSDTAIQLASTVQQSVQQHKTVHPAQQNKRFKCTFSTCLKAYNSKNGLRYHMRQCHPPA